MTPRSAVVQTERFRPGWDVRAWRIGLTGSLLASLGVISGDGTGLGKTLAASAPGIAESLVVAGALLIILVLPGVLTGIARRRWLIWSYLPMIVLFLTIVTASLIAAMEDTSPSGPTSWTRTDTVAVIAVVLSPLAIAIPVALGRLWMYSNRARRAARLAFEESQYTMERVGVWPPPPNANATDGEVRENNSFQ